MSSARVQRRSPIRSSLSVDDVQSLPVARELAGGSVLYVQSRVWGAWAQVHAAVWERRGKESSSATLLRTSLWTCRAPLGARICIVRGRLWQAEYWISAARDQALSLACRHRSLATSYGRAFDDLPIEILEPFTEALVGSLDRGRLLQALGRTVDGLLRNSQDVRELAAKLEGQLRELASVA